MNICHIHDSISFMRLGSCYATRPYTRRLGRGSNVVGRGRGGCHIHNWAEAVMQKPLAKLKYYRPTDGPMDL